MAAKTSWHRYMERNYVTVALCIGQLTTGYCCCRPNLLRVVEYRTTAAAAASGDLATARGSQGASRVSSRGADEHAERSSSSSSSSGGGGGRYLSTSAITALQHLHIVAAFLRLIAGDAYRLT